MNKAIAGLFTGIGIGLVFALIVAGILLVNYINNRYPVITTQPTTQLQNYVIEQPIVDAVIQEQPINSIATATAAPAVPTASPAEAAPQVELPPTPTAERVLTAEQLAACAAAREAGRRLAPYCPREQAPGVGR